jgi:hypothetical protein
VERVDESEGGVSRSPCVRCGNVLHTGEGRVTVTFSVAEMVELALATSDINVRSRLLCAISLLDEDAANGVRQEMWR